MTAGVDNLGVATWTARDCPLLAPLDRWKVL